jgi:hypothetical protein
MSIKPIKADSPPSVFGSDAAPIIYFDGVIAWGHRDGIVQLELGANHLVPVAGGGTVKTKVVVTAHLRCSAGTLHALREILELMAAPQLKQ